MIMKKSRHILGISIVLLVTSVLILSLSNNKDIQEDDPLITGDKFVEWGDTLKKYSYIPETTSNNIASYENIDFITVPQKEIDQTIEFYKLRGINDEAAAEKAENYCKQGVMTKKDYKYLALDEGGKFVEVMLREGFDAPDEELDQVYMDLTNGPQLHTGDELIFAMDGDANILTDLEGEFWYIYGDEYGKFYEIEENQYMRIFSTNGESGLTIEISEIEPKILDKVFTIEELGNIF